MQESIEFHTILQTNETLQITDILNLKSLLLHLNTGHMYKALEIMEFTSIVFKEKKHL